MNYRDQVVARLIDSGRLAEIIELCGETNDYEYIAEVIVDLVQGSDYEVSVGVPQADYDAPF